MLPTINNLLYKHNASLKNEVLCYKSPADLVA